MTDIPITANERKAQFTGNTGLGPFAFTFNILTNSDIRVIKNSTVLTLTSEYTVTTNANGTGSITLTGSGNGTALISTDILTIIGNRQLARTSDYVQGGNLFAEALNEDLDSIVIMMQQLDEKVSRTMRIDAGDIGQNLLLPSKASRLNRTLQFNATTGDPEAGPTAADVANAQTNAANAAASASAAANSAAAAATFDPASIAITGGTIENVAISNSTIDNTVIGGSTPAAISGTTGSFSGNLTVDTDTLFVDAANNRVGVGTASPAQKLVTYAASTNLEILNTVRNDNTSAGVAAIGFNVSSNTEGDYTQAGIGFVRSVANGGGALAFYNKSDGATGNFTAANERMRLDSSGNFVIGATASAARFAVISAQQGNFGNRQIYIEDSTASVGQPGIGFHASANSSAGIIRFYGPSNQFEIRNSADTGFIEILASAFVVSSDYRLKENIVPLVGACDRLKQIPVHRFNFKPLEETGVEFHDMTVDGFLAHEVQPFVPEAITGEKDAVDGAGKPAYQGIDQSKLVPLLTAALQEALARIETLEADVAALKGEPA